MADTVLSVRGLSVRFETESGAVEAVKGIDLDVDAGETVAIVGESGSGKSQTMMAVMGLLARNGRADGSVRYRGEEILGLPARALNRYRGRKITMIFQEPMTSLDPLYRIGEQIAEPLMRHAGLSRTAARRRAVELLDLVHIPDPERRLAAYPHELSGGQRQRVMIAMALANDPDILIADEPTTALDVTVQARILELLSELKARLGMAIVFITHDLGIVRRFADRTYVMKSGEVVESGATGTLFERPRHDYTRMLIEAEPSGRKSPPPPDSPTVLTAEDVRVVFTRHEGLFGRRRHDLRAVDGVDLTVRRGETVGVVGESGSGKSTLGRALLRLMPAAGLVRYEDRALMPLDRAAMRPLRRHMQLVFQDPFGSLSPRLTAGEIVTEGLLVHEPGLTRAERDRRAAFAFEEVWLDPATRHRFPHEFSGGQRQRIAIARAMILKPALVVLDEPTSALDRSVQKSIVELLRHLQEKHGLAYIFISHDLAVVRALSDEIMVMKSGKVVERGSVEAIFDKPREAYTRELIAAAFLDGRGVHMEAAAGPGL
ncbi:ABC transporter ATP-binding protein [Chelatococcus daeguensis]|uniref:Microcin ABC transporter ATP-binding protein n=1 Tax=Chelatococcus daeguensis TaxID=444444 RepID=A0AAC9JUJ8_9HYPH|nr:ABC transporter ATP-binding protein [Chelatococcus daeguensis]APF38685.1 microcin ABC transporter ATP-binding protein [Chelatococcus daeguensis]KZE28291.1 microcin ABC transporter ATP-binding protein [Chelatococcus daeguensis]MBM3084345.1 ABC transporter ATP-binding protein [Chelatococcus daeguensis]